LFGNINPVSNIYFTEVVLKELTVRQKEVLEAIREYIADPDHGYAPTIRELSEILKIYPKCVYDHIRTLERKGYLHKEDGKCRTMVLLK
jgi:Mn-dependent DtxR family transcriptional regulator